jgi:hypothetical protein
MEVNYVKSGFFFASKRNEIFASISNFASEAKVRAHPSSEANGIPPAWKSVAKSIVPDWGVKVNSGIGFSYHPARLRRLASRYNNPMPESALYPLVRDYIFGYWSRFGRPL